MKAFEIKLENKDVDVQVKTIGADTHIVVGFEDTAGPVEPPPVEPPPVEPPPVEPPRDDLRVYDEDLDADSGSSTSLRALFPKGLESVFSMEYLGSFRVLARGESSSNYAVGTLGLSHTRNSIFVAGHAHHNAIAEFNLDVPLSKDPDPRNIPNASVLQSYTKVLGFDEDGKHNDKITGMEEIDGKLWVNSEIWYDAPANNQDALLILDIDNLAGSDKTKFNRVQGDAKAGGYMGRVPADAQELLGGKYYTGWASNYSINSRYSIGPSFYTFDPNMLIDEVLPTTPKIVYPFPDHKMTPRGNATADDNPESLWNVAAKCAFSFVVPNTKLLVCVGRSGLWTAPIIYKTDPRYPDKRCGGSCPVNGSDLCNFFWVFDLTDLKTAEAPWDIQPKSYGRWSHPHDDDGANVIGADYDIEKELLYVALSGKAQTGRYDRPPLINVYSFKNKG